MLFYKMVGMLFYTALQLSQRYCAGSTFLPSFFILLKGSVLPPHLAQIKNLFPLINLKNLLSPIFSIGIT